MKITLPDTMSGTRIHLNLNHDLGGSQLPDRTTPHTPDTGSTLNVPFAQGYGQQDPFSTPTKSRRLIEIDSNEDTPNEKRSQLKCPSFMNGDLTTVKLVLISGAISETYVIHKSFLTYHSTYFNSMFNGTFAEAKTGVCHYNEPCAAAFRLMLDWVYSQQVKTEGIVMDDLVNLWILADAVLMPKLQNDTIRALEVVSQTKFELSPTAYDRIYTDTVEGSKLRKFVVDYLAATPNVTFADIHTVPREMLYEMWVAAKQMIPASKKGTKFSTVKMKQYVVDEKLPEHH